MPFFRIACLVIASTVAAHAWAAAPVRTEAPTALADHVAFFKNARGKITYGSTYRGLRRLGANPLYAGVNAFFGLGARTTKSRLFALEVKPEQAQDGVYRNEHTETRIFTKRGAYDAKRFEEIWQKYDSGGKGYFSDDDIARLVGDITQKGTMSRHASQLGFRLLQTLAGERDAAGKPVVFKETLREHYLGTLFPRLAAERVAADQARKLHPQRSFATVLNALAGATHLRAARKDLHTDEPR
jgi:hypothetical protein